MLSSCFTKFALFNGAVLILWLASMGQPERSATLKKSLLMGLTVASLALLAGRAQAFGHRCCIDYCCPPPCNVKVTYVDKVVTCYKPVWKEEKVKCVVNKVVCREEIETRKCTVMVPKWVEEKRTCTYLVQVPKTVEREVLSVVCREEFETRKCTVMVPKWTDEKRTCTYLIQVPKTVEREILVCRMVPVQMVDECTGCTYTCCKPETVKQKVKCTVYECKEAKKDIVVKVCHHEAQEREYKVRRIVPETVKQKVKCTVYECKEAKKDIVVRVCHHEEQIREYKVKRIIPECVQETVDTVRRYCVMQPYQTTVKVAVCVPCD
jgi:hypothetical protein